MNLIRHKASAQPGKPLDLDLETAPDTPPDVSGFRAWVGGLLYIEGIVVLLLGSLLLAGYWPPTAGDGQRPNPVGQLGLWIVITALAYMICVGFGFFIYHLVQPLRSAPLPNHSSGAVQRARRYAAMKKRTYYIFDNTIKSPADADDAMKARDLY